MNAKSNGELQQNELKPLTLVVPATGKMAGNEELAKYCESLRSEYALNKKILLVQVPQFNFKSFNREVAENRGYYAYPPTGLQWLAQAISHRGLDVEILDLNYETLRRIISDKSFNYADWLDILDEYLEKHNPSVIGATCISVSDVFTGVHPFTNLLEHLHKKDEHIVIGGGVIATNEFENYLKMDLSHFVIKGEGENKINFLFDNLHDTDFGSMPTPEIYFKYNQQLKHTYGKEDRVALKGNINNTYKFVPIADYNNVGSLNPYSRMAGQDTKFATIQLVRGCRADCMFCGVSKFMGRGTRSFPPSDLLDEINYLVKEKGVRHFEWLDDDLLNARIEVAEVLKGMADLRQNHNYNITWSANNGLIASSLNEEILSLMRDSGCLGFRIGIESGNDAMLRRIRKPATKGVLRKACDVINKFPEIFIGANYIVGLFGEETFGQMLDTFKFSCETNLDWSSFTTFQYTSTETIAKEQLKVHNNEVKEFVPSKNTSEREIEATDGIITGPELFNLPKDSIPSAEQVRHIWFGFNLVSNYINNKNLKPGGRPQKLTSWVEMVQIVYPNNPYMFLFAGLGRVLLNDNKTAEQHIANARKILKESGYWKSRFDQYGLTKIVDDFPKTSADVYNQLESLQSKYSAWLK